MSRDKKPRFAIRAEKDIAARFQPAEMKSKERAKPPAFAEREVTSKNLTNAMLI